MAEPVKAGAAQSFVIGSRTPRDQFDSEAIRYQQGQHANLMDALEELGHPVDRENFTARMHDPEFAEDVRTALKVVHEVPDSSTFFAKYGGRTSLYPDPEYKIDPNAQRTPSGSNQVRVETNYDLPERATQEALQEPADYWDVANRMLTPRRVAAKQYEQEETQIPVTAKVTGALSDIGSLPGRTVAGVGSAINVGARDALAKLLGMNNPEAQDIDIGTDVANAFYQSMAAPKGITGNAVGDIGTTILKDPLGPLMLVTGPNLQAPARSLAQEIGVAATPTVERSAMLGGSKPSLVKRALGLPTQAIEALDARYNLNPARVAGTQGAAIGAGGAALSQPQSSRPADPLEFVIGAGAGALQGAIPASLLASQQRAVLENFPGQFAARAKEAVQGSNRISQQINPLDIANILTSVERPGTISTYGNVSRNLRDVAKERMNAATEAATRDIVEGRATGLPLTPQAEFQRTGGLESPAFIEPSPERYAELGVNGRFPIPYYDVGEGYTSTAGKPSNLAALLEQHLGKVSAGTPASITKARRDFMSTLSAVPSDRIDFTSPTLLPHNAANIADIVSRVEGSAGVRPVDTRLNEVLRKGGIEDAAAAHRGLYNKFSDVNRGIDELDKQSSALGKSTSQVDKYIESFIDDLKHATTNEFNPLMKQADELQRAGKPIPKALVDKLNEVTARLDASKSYVESMLEKKQRNASDIRTAHSKLFDEGLLSQQSWNEAVAKALDAQNPSSLEYPFQVLPKDVPWMKKNLNEVIRKSSKDSRVQRVDEALAIKDALNQFQESFPSYLPTLGDKANKQWGLAAKLDETLAKYPPNAGTKRVDRGSTLEFIPGIGGAMARMFNPNTKNYLKNVTGTATQYKLLPEAYRKLEAPMFQFLPAFSAYGPGMSPATAGAAREVRKRVRDDTSEGKK